MTDLEPWITEPINPALVAPARKTAIATAVVVAALALILWVV